jgi:hypothetical protein
MAGPYAYARAGFGNLAGFMNAWLYRLTTWVERRDRNRLGALRRTVRQYRPCDDRYDPADAGRDLARRGDQPGRNQENGPDPSVDIAAQIRAPAADVHDRSGVHRSGQLRHLERQRQEHRIFSMLFVVYSTNTEATGFAVYEPSSTSVGALLLGVPVYLVNRSRMTAPPPPPADSLL